MLKSLSMPALALSIGLSATPLSSVAALQFRCSDTLTSDTSNGLIMRCSGVLDVLGDGAHDPDSLLANEAGIRLHGELGLTLDKLTLIAPIIDLSVAQGPLQLGQDVVLRGHGRDDVRPQVHLSVGGTRPEVPLTPIGGSLVISNGSDVGKLTPGPGFDVVGAPGRPGGSVVVGAGNLLPTGSGPTLPLPQVGQVPEPGSWALMLAGLTGLMGLRKRRH